MREVRRLGPEVVRQAGHGLTDHLQVPGDHVLAHGLGQECLLAGGGVVLESLDGVGDVPKREQPVLHNGTASDNTLSRMYGLRPPSVMTSTGRHPGPARRAYSSGDESEVGDEGSIGSIGGRSIPSG